MMCSIEKRVPGRQRGITLIISLIMLAALMLAGIAAMRSVDTGLLAAGNLTLRQATTSMGDQALETATSYLRVQNAAALINDVAGAAYFASDQNLTRQQLLNPATYTALDAAFPPIVDPVRRMTIRYMIHRMCATAGVHSTSGCAYYTPPDSADASCKDVNCLPIQSNPMLVYRITAMITGPRNSTSFVQTFVTGRT